MLSRDRVRALLAASSAALLGAACVSAAVPAEAAAVPLRVIGGPGHALVYPSGLEVAPSGDIVLADTGNDGIAKFTSGGQLVWRRTSFVSPSDSLENARDIAIDAAGAIYVADDAKFRILKFSASGSPIGTAWTGPAGDRIGSPIGISEKNGLLYVADAARRKVRIFDLSGTQVDTMTSNGTCDFSALRDVDADEDGNVYIANYLNNNILKLSPNGTCITKWGIKGTAPGQFKNPYGVRLAVDPVWGESVYVADSNNNRIQVFSKTGAFRASVGSTGGAPDEFVTVRRVAVAADGDIWGADLWGWKAARYNRTSGGYTYAQSIGGSPPPTTATSLFNEPRGLAVAADGTVDIADTVNQRIVSTTSTGAVIRTCGARTNATTSVNWPRGVAIDPMTGDRWIADTKQSRIQIWKAGCGSTARVGTLGAGTGQLNWPYAIAIRGSDRTAFLADTKNNRIVAWDVATRTQVAAFGTLGSGSNQLNSPRSVVSVDGGDRLLVADSKNNRVVELSYTRAGGFSFVRTLSAGLNGPEGAAQDSTGKIWVSDTGGNRVLLLNPNGSVAQTIATASGKALKRPSSITATGGKVYVSDTENDRVLVYNAGG